MSDRPIERPDPPSSPGFSPRDKSGHCVAAVNASVAAAAYAAAAADEKKSRNFNKRRVQGAVGPLGNSRAQELSFKTKWAKIAKKYQEEGRCPDLSTTSAASKARNGRRQSLAAG